LGWKKAQLKMTEKLVKRGGKGKKVVFTLEPLRSSQSKDGRNFTNGRLKNRGRKNHRKQDGRFPKDTLLLLIWNKKKTSEGEILKKTRKHLEKKGRVITER